ncbi:MAG: hypothetical protein PHQ22_08770 [Sulfuricurvum sp.]|nr:hypothetical protein [Sulfuricurvum sp.]MDD5387271.1 hypothetical protein [Sulfuricurvum sp.]
MEELISIQKYAAQNRQSIHNVIKKTMNGELKTVVKEENGKEVTYIIASSAVNTPTLTVTSSEESEIDYQKEYELLHKKYLILKTKYEKLLNT